MKKAVPVFLFAVLIAVFGFQVRSAEAYEQYSQNKDATYCRACHGDFRATNYTSLSDGQSWGNLHNIHRTDMLNNDCNTCHSSGGTFPVILDSSVGGTGLSPISCVGCHGRSEDAGHDGTSGGLGAGLRQHHYTAGVTICANCHSDAEPATYTPVGENVLPPYYGNSLTAHPNMPTNPCNQDGNENFAGGPEGLDNDGNDIYDGNDPACQAAAPQIEVTPASPYEYGPVTVLTSSSQEFTISNTGTADLVITDGVLSDEANFAVDGNSGSSPCGELPVTITPSNLCTVLITFTPQAVASYAATVTVTSNSATNSTLVINLTGDGVTGPAPGAQVSPTSVDFGVVNVGDSPATEVTISNTGTDNLVVSNIALDNTDVYALDLAAGANPCGSTTPTIVPNDNCTVEVVFTPLEDGGPFTATMTVSSNVPNVNVPITGNGFLDSDGDGVSDSVDEFPNNPSKATPVAATGTKKILVDATPDTLSNVAAVAVAPGQAVSGFTFPDGLVTFQVAVAAPGDNAVVTLTFPSGQPSTGKYFKDDGSDGALVEFDGDRVTINTDNVVLTLTDGGSGDNDNTADSMINDPGGLGTPVSSGGGGGGGGCSVTGQGSSAYGTAAVIFLTLLAILVALRQRGARARR